MTVLLVVVAMVVAVNPPRRVLELDPRPALPVAALAGVGVVAATVAVAAMSGPLLDALDVSAPTFRIAAGLVLGFRALVDLVRAPKREPEGLSGWGEALYPVGFPVLFRPEVAVVALAAGADPGVAITAGGAVVAVGLGAVSVARWPGTRFARALGAFVSGLAVAVGVALVVSGVLDI